MKLLLLSMHYAPEPCDSRTSHLAKALAAMGHRVQALTSFPNYPFGKVYDGYKQSVCEKMQLDGVEVVRVPMVPDHSKSIKKRATSYLSFMTSAAFLGALFTRRPDLLWIHHPPLSTAFAGWFLATVKRVPFVLEIHDLWPETLVSTGMIREGKVTRAIRWICDRLHRKATAIVVTSPGMKENLIGHGTEASKIHVVPQFADLSRFAPVERDSAFGLEHGLDRTFNVIFAGNIGTAQALDILLDAADRLRDLPDFRFVVLGDGVERQRLQSDAEARGLTNLRFLGHRPESEMTSFFAWAEGLLVHLKEDPLFAITIPSKTQAYLAAERPILCGVGGDTADLVSETGAGLTFKSESSEDLERAVRTLYAMPLNERVAMAERGKEAAENFSVPNLSERYDLMFEAIVYPKPITRPVVLPVQR